MYVSGDFNSRTPDSLNYFDFDKYLGEPVFMLNTSDILVRKNKDRIINCNGIRLLEACKATGLLLVNGRLSNDESKGNFTFCSHTRQCTVDYLLTNFCDFTTLTYFEVQVFNEYSHHAPILFKLHAKSFNNTNLQQETQNQTIKRKIIWDKNKIADFENELVNNYEAFQRLTNDAPTEDINHVIQDFTRFMHDNAFDVFGKTYTDNIYTSQRKKVRND